VPIVSVLVVSIVVVVAGVAVGVVFRVVHLGERYAGVLLVEPGPPLPP
jgi:hypothetical protein